MVTGWWAGFLILTVFVGLRMTPPRGDNWAGCAGMTMAAMLWCVKKDYLPVLYSLLVTGFAGGMSFIGVAWAKLMLVWFGNPNVWDSAADSPYWRHWQGQNWHSWLEQSTGFVNGIGAALAMGILASRLPKVSDDPPIRRWTEVFAITWVWPVLVFLNLRKNLDDWVNPDKGGTVPERMKMPMLFPDFDMSADAWFAIVFFIIFAVPIALMILHLRRGLPLPAVPSSWLGRGQLLFLMILWSMAIGNFEKLVVQFTGGRILTEGVIFVNSALASLLIFTLPREHEYVPAEAAEPAPWPRLLRRAVAVGLVLYVAAVPAFTGSVRALYGNAHAGHSGPDNIRFGENAQWRVSPRLRVVPVEERQSRE